MFLTFIVVYNYSEVPCWPTVRALVQKKHQENWFQLVVIDLLHGVISKGFCSRL